MGGFLFLFLFVAKGEYGLGAGKQTSAGELFLSCWLERWSGGNAIGLLRLCFQGA
jgi:hypothetical protein